MRKLAIALAIIIVIAIIFIAALPFIVDVNQYRPRVQSKLEELTGRKVSLGKMELSVFPLAIKVDNAIVAEDPEFPTGHPFAQANQLYVSVELLPLLRKEVNVNSLELRQPKIELVRNGAGAWNFSTLGEKNHAQTGNKPSVSLDELKVTDGEVALTDYQKKQPRAVYDHIDMSVQDFAPGKKFSLEVAAHLPGAGAETIRLSGDAGPLRSDNLANTFFDGTLEMDEVSFAGLKGFLKSEKLKDVDFVATGKTSLKNENGNLSSKGDLKLTQGKVHRVEIGYPITADYDISDDLNNDVLKIEKGKLKLGGTPLSVQGLVNSGATPAQIDLKVQTSDASISDAARLAAAFGIAFNPGMQINGKLDVNASARGAMNNPLLEGTVNGQQLVITGKQLPQPVHVTNIKLDLSPQAIRANPFVATTGSTAVQVQAAINQYTSKSPQLDASIRSDNAQLGELLNIAQSFGVSSLDDIKGKGPISLNVRLQGPMKNFAAMNYSGSGTLRNASLELPSLNQPLQVKTADLSFNRDSVALNGLGFSLGSTNAHGDASLKGLGANATPQIQFNLTADQWKVMEWQQMMKTPAPKSAALETGLIPEAYAQKAAVAEPSFISRLVGGGHLTIGTVLYDQLTLHNLQSQVKLDHGVIRLEPFTSDVYGGKQSGSIIIDTRPAVTTYSAALDLMSVDANQFLSSVTPLQKVLYGALGVNGKVNFSGSEGSRIARSLNGKLGLNLQNGKLANVDLLSQLANIGKFLQAGRTSEPYTNITKMAGDFTIQNGVARTNNLVATIEGGSLSAAGAVDMATQQLDMDVTAVLSPEMSQKVGGTSIGGYANTALANAKGELVMPVKITGTFSSPRVAPDLEKLAKMKLENLLPSSNNPGSFTSRILQGVLGGKGANQGTAPTNPLQQILGGGQNQQQQQQQQAQPEGDQGQTSPQQQPQQKKQPPNVFEDIFNAVTGQKQQKQQQQQQQPPPKQQQQQSTEPPK